MTQEKNMVQDNCLAGAWCWHCQDPILASSPANPLRLWDQNQSVELFSVAFSFKINTFPLNWRFDLAASFFR